VRDGACDVHGAEVNRLQSETSFKKGVRAKQMKANRNTDYLEKVIFFWQVKFMLLPCITY